MRDRPLFPMHKRALVSIAETGTGPRWLARDLTDDGLILRACHTRGGHTCSRATCDGYMRWTPTPHGAHLAWVLRTISDELHLDDADQMEQLTIPGVAA